MWRKLFGGASAPPSKDEFAELVLGELSSLHHAGELRYDPGGPRIVRGVGDRIEGEWDLSRLYRDYLKVSPKARPAFMKGAVRSLKERRTSAPVAIFSRARFEAEHLERRHTELVPIDDPGTCRVPHVRIGEHLVVALTRSGDTTPLDRQAVRQTGLSIDRAVEQAVRRADAEADGARRFEPVADGVFRSTAMSVARALLSPSSLEAIGELSVKGSPVAVAPTAGGLFVTGDADDAGLSWIAQQEPAGAPLSWVPLRLAGGAWHTWMPDAPGMLAQRVLTERCDDYARHFEGVERSLSICDDVLAPLIVVEDEDGSVRHDVVWPVNELDPAPRRYATPRGAVVLPEAAFARLTLRVGSEKRVVSIAPFQAAKEAFADRVERAGHYPPRWRLAYGFGDEDKWRLIGLGASPSLPYWVLHPSLAKGDASPGEHAEAAPERRRRFYDEVLPKMLEGARAAGRPPPLEPLIPALLREVLAGGSAERERWAVLAEPFREGVLVLHEHPDALACLAHLTAGQLLQAMGVPLDQDSLVMARSWLPDLDVLAPDLDAWRASQALIHLALDIEPPTWRVETAVGDDSYEPPRPLLRWIETIRTLVEAGGPYDEAVTLFRAALAGREPRTNDADLVWLATLVHHRLGGHPMADVADWMRSQVQRARDGAS